MTDSLKTPLVVVGRVLLALIFVTSGYGKLAGLEGTAGYIASVGLPWPTALAVAAGLFELLAGLALVVGFKARWAAFALGAFTLLASLLFHAYWAAPEDQQFVQQLMFMKNLAIAGGLFIVAAFGAGRLGFDGRTARA
jgi:putative oxidoreductase